MLGTTGAGAMGICGGCGCGGWGAKGFIMPPYMPACRASVDVMPMLAPSCRACWLVVCCRRATSSAWCAAFKPDVSRSMGHWSPLAATTNPRPLGMPTRSGCSRKVTPCSPSSASNADSLLLNVTSAWVSRKSRRSTGPWALNMARRSRKWDPAFGARLPAYTRLSFTAVDDSAAAWKFFSASDDLIKMGKPEHVHPGCFMQNLRPLSNMAIGTLSSSANSTYPNPLLRPECLSVMRRTSFTLPTASKYSATCCPVARATSCDTNTVRAWRVTSAASRSSCRAHNNTQQQGTASWGEGEREISAGGCRRKAHASPYNVVSTGKAVACRGGWQLMK